MDELRRRGRFVRLEILGDGPALPVLKTLVAERGLADRIHFGGRLPDIELAARVAAAWVNLQLSVAEGWGLSALEAAACGVPTLGYEVAGVRDSVRAGVTGELVPSGDVVTLADRAEAMLGSVDRYRAPARAHAETFRWDRAASAWRTMLEARSTAAA